MLELDALVGGPDVVEQGVGVLAEHVLPVVARHVVPLHLGIRVKWWKPRVNMRHSCLAWI